MCFAQPFFLLFLLIAAFATTGQAVVVDPDGSFGATAIKSFTFTSGSGTGSCLVAAALIFRHSAKFRK